jgi:nucleotide-binding universal stress UspA family protein
MEITTILLPVDGSEHSIRAAEYAAGLATTTGAQIILLHCHRPFPVILGEPYYQRTVNKILKAADALLAPFRQRLAQHGVQFVERLMEGPPRQVVPDVAAIEKCDLIVIGSRGLSDLQGLFIGSVTHRVLRSATCPVLVIR